jgi:hypothetical protein
MRSYAGSVAGTTTSHASRRAGVTASTRPSLSTPQPSRSRLNWASSSSQRCFALSCSARVTRIAKAES